MDPAFKADLNEYVTQCKIRLQKILQQLDWTESATIKDYNTNSIASTPKSALERSNSNIKCTYPASCVNKNCLVLDTPKLQSILKNNEIKAPENFQELQSNFSREQKLKIYEHVVKNTDKLEYNLVEEEIKGEISLADILAQKKREEKRKKRRFRKSIPTHIEEVRCLVDLQMQALEQFRGNKIDKTETSIGLSGHIKQDDYRKADKSLMKDYERKRGHREIKAEHHKIKGRYKNRLEESNHHRRSSSRKRDDRNHRGREKRRRSRSTSRNAHQERRKHRSKSRNKSKEKQNHRKRSRSRSKNGLKNEKYHRSDRRSRSRNREISKSRKTSKTNHYEIESNGSYQKYYNRDKHSREKRNNDKYNRNQSQSPERKRKIYRESDYYGNKTHKPHQR